MNHNVVIRLEDVYKSDYTIPEGYEAEAFRIPKANEYWLGVRGQVASPGDQLPLGPRVILTKVPLPKKLSFGLEINHDNRQPKIRFSLKCGEASFFIYPENVKEILDYARTEMGWKV